MFQPCLDRILICLIWSLIYYKSQDIYFVDMDYVDESDVVMFTEAYPAMYLRENRFHI